jgi:hypothetical protein
MSIYTYFSSFWGKISEKEKNEIRNFKKFLIDNSIISTTAGVVIGYAAWDCIQSLVGNLLFPAFYFFVVLRFVNKGHTVSKLFSPVEPINIPKVFIRFLAFFIIIILTFYIIHNITNNWIDEPSFAPSSGNIASVSSNVPVAQLQVVQHAPTAVIPLPIRNIVDHFQYSTYK